MAAINQKKGEGNKEAVLCPLLATGNLTETTHLFQIGAPDVGRRARAGQFVVIRIDEKGERIPLTLTDRDKESVTLVVQEVGATTRRLSRLKVNELKRLRKEAQSVFQDLQSSLDPRMTVGDSIGKARVIHSYDDEKARLEKVEELLYKVRLEPGHAGRYLHEFSGGQKQRGDCESTGHKSQAHCCR